MNGEKINDTEDSVPKTQAKLARIFTVSSMKSDKVSKKEQNGNIQQNGHLTTQVKTVLPMTTMEDDSIVEENGTTVVDIA